jgi:hypothetical protein
MCKSLFLVSTWNCDLFGGSSRNCNPYAANFEGKAVLAFARKKLQRQQSYPSQPHSTFSRWLQWLRGYVWLRKIERPPKMSRRNPQISHSARFPPTFLKRKLLIAPAMTSLTSKLRNVEKHPPKLPVPAALGTRFVGLAPSPGMCRCSRSQNVRDPCAVKGAANGPCGHCCLSAGHRKRHPLLTELRREGYQRKTWVSRMPSPSSLFCPVTYTSETSHMSFPDLGLSLRVQGNYWFDHPAAAFAASHASVRLSN